MEEVKISFGSKSVKKVSKLFLEWESVAGGVEDPGVVVGALHAGVQSKSFSWKLSGVEGASVWQRAVGLALVVALLLPLGEVPKASQLSGVLHPLDNLFGKHSTPIKYRHCVKSRLFTLKWVASFKLGSPGSEQTKISSYLLTQTSIEWS